MFDNTHAQVGMTCQGLYLTHIHAYIKRLVLYYQIKINLVSPSLLCHVTVLAKKKSHPIHKERLKNIQSTNKSIQDFHMVGQCVVLTYNHPYRTQSLQVSRGGPLAMVLPNRHYRNRNQLSLTSLVSQMRTLLTSKINPLTHLLSSQPSISFL